MSVIYGLLQDYSAKYGRCHLFTLHKTYHRWQFLKFQNIKMYSLIWNSKIDINFKYIQWVVLWKYFTCGGPNPKIFKMLSVLVFEISTAVVRRDTLYSWAAYRNTTNAHSPWFNLTMCHLIYMFLERSRDTLSNEITSQKHRKCFFWSENFIFFF